MYAENLGQGFWAGERGPFSAEIVYNVIGVYDDVYEEVPIKGAYVTLYTMYTETQTQALARMRASIERAPYKGEKRSY